MSKRDPNKRITAQDIDLDFPVESIVPLDELKPGTKCVYRMGFTHDGNWAEFVRFEEVKGVVFAVFKACGAQYYSGNYVPIASISHISLVPEDIYDAHEYTVQVERVNENNGTQNVNHETTRKEIAMALEAKRGGGKIGGIIVPDQATIVTYNSSKN